MGTSIGHQNGSKMVKILLPIDLKENMLMCEFVRDFTSNFEKYKIML
jgi:hypothetical protein